MCIFKGFSILVALAIIDLSGNVTRAAVVYASASGGEPNFVTVSGQPVPNGNSFRIGAFRGLSDSQVRALASLVKTSSDLDALDDAFVEFGAISFQLGGGQINSKVSGSASSSRIENLPIYWWITKTTDNSSPNARFSNAEEWGLFSGSGPEWIFPQDFSPDPEASPSSASISTIVGKLAAVSAPVVGGPPVVGGQTPQTFTVSLQLSPVIIVPEPSSSLLLLTGLAGLILRRSRR